MSDRDAEIGKAVILVVEDDMDLAHEIRDTLDDYGMAPVVAATWDEALASLALVQPAVILLDQRLGTTDAVQHLPQLRDLTDADVVVVTGNQDEMDRVVALEFGADGFLLKPIAGRELVARIRAQLRRRRHRTTAAPTSRAKWAMDTRRRVIRRPDGTEVALTGTEFNLIAILAEAPSRVLDRDTLTRRALCRSGSGGGRAIDNLIARLRRKLGADGQRMIRTIRGHGYAFTGFPSH